MTTHGHDEHERTSTATAMKGTPTALWIPTSGSIRFG